MTSEHELNYLADECLELDELFARVDRIGRKYQEPEEIEAFEQQLFELNQEIQSLA